MIILVLLFKNKINMKYNHESYDENKRIKIKTIGEMIVINGFLIFLFNCYEGIEFMINNGVHEGSHNVEAHGENIAHDMEIHSE